MWKILPILLNTEMVKATLAGGKTCTRRVIKDTVKENQEINKNGKGEFELYDITSRCSIPKGKIYKPPYQPGDILYVRETWSEWTDGYIYKAWNSPFPQVGKSSVMKWKPSIHMPKEAARIWLKVTDVRVERLQKMTDEDCEKEGLENACKKCESHLFNCDICMNNDGIKEEFKELWDSTIKKADIDKYGWSANPWVWVIEFERCEEPGKE